MDKPGSNKYSILQDLIYHNFQIALQQFNSFQETLPCSGGKSIRQFYRQIYRQVFYGCCLLLICLLWETYWGVNWECFCTIYQGTSLYSGVVRDEVKMITSTSVRNTNDFRDTFLTLFKVKSVSPGRQKVYFSF